MLEPRQPLPLTTNEAFPIHEKIYSSPFLLFLRALRRRTGKYSIVQRAETPLHAPRRRAGRIERDTH